MPEYKDTEEWIKKTAESWIKAIEAALQKIKPRKREKSLLEFKNKTNFLLKEKLKEI